MRASRYEKFLAIILSDSEAADLEAINVADHFFYTKLDQRKYVNR